MNIIKYLGKGAMHKKSNKACEDYADYRASDEGKYILAVSDGCSSSKYAELASRANVNSVISYFENNSLDEFLRLPYGEQQKTILENAITAIAEEAEKLGSNKSSDFCATLLFAVCDGEKILFGHIGDGNIFALNDENRVIFQSAPENNGASNMTFFTTTREQFRLRLAVVPAYNISSIYMGSDGTEKILKSYHSKSDDFSRLAEELDGKKLSAIDVLKKAYTIRDENAITRISRLVNEDKVANCEQLIKELLSMICVYDEYADDWSVLYYAKNQAQCSDNVESINDTLELFASYSENRYHEEFLKQNQAEKESAEEEDKTTDESQTDNSNASETTEVAEADSEDKGIKEETEIPEGNNEKASDENDDPEAGVKIVNQKNEKISNDDAEKEKSKSKKIFKWFSDLLNFED